MIVLSEEELREIVRRERQLKDKISFLKSELKEAKNRYSDLARVTGRETVHAKEELLPSRTARILHLQMRIDEALLLSEDRSEVLLHAGQSLINYAAHALAKLAMEEGSEQSLETLRIPIPQTISLSSFMEDWRDRVS